MKTWRDINREIRTHKNQDEDAKGTMDRTNYKYITKMCSTCRFYEEGCKKKRTIRVCAEKGLKNKE